MSKTMNVGSGSVKIRMYKQGFGDCFLIAFPGRDEKPKHVLIDCGVHHKDKDNKKKMTLTAESIKEATDGHLELVVVTHEHTDHIDGFKLAEPVFKDMTMENVWMGWTENYDDPRVKALDKTLDIYLAALRILRDDMKSSRTSLWEMLDNLLGFYAEELGAAGRMSNRETMKWLHKMGGPGMKFCSPGELLTLEGLDGVSFFVLGPPLLDKYLKKSAPSKGAGKETYLTDPENAHLEDFALEVIRSGADKKGVACAADVGETLSGRYPFEDRYRIPVGEAKDRAHSVFDEYLSTKNDWRRIDNKWREMAEELALKLDDHTNNTSLALAIEIGKGGKVLLFPADGQVGNWLSWGDLKWKRGRRELTIDNLLERTVLYKVGHHGSHNATLKSNGLEKMSHPELTAMLPVDEDFAKSVNWKRIPFPDLLERLRVKCCSRVLRSDKPIPRQKDRPYNLGKKEWRDFIGRISETESFIELTIAL